uniref:Uncharacterized protein n=1 Tax=Anguilla anguilla TaxID=7936 RepID=A0A0E9XJ00_ANGAN
MLYVFGKCRQKKNVVAMLRMLLERDCFAMLERPCRFFTTSLSPNMATPNAAVADVRVERPSACLPSCSSGRRRLRGGGCRIVTGSHPFVGFSSRLDIRNNTACQ